MAKKLTAEERKRRAAERQRKVDERKRTPAERQKRIDEFLDGFPGLIERMLHPVDENAGRSPKNRAAMILQLLEKYTMVASEHQISPPELDTLLAKSRETLGAPEGVDPHETFLLYFELGLESQKAFDAWLRRKHEEAQAGRSRGGLKHKEKLRSDPVSDEEALVRAAENRREQHPDWHTTTIARSLAKIDKRGRSWNTIYKIIRPRIAGRAKPK